MRPPERAGVAAEPAAEPRRAALFGAVALAAILTRWLYLAPLSLFLTNDSPSYLAIARRLAQLDTSHPRLGNTRMPGYPTFLALLDQLGLLHAPGVLAAQCALGVTAALLAAWIGSRLAGLAGALVLGLAMALSPVSIVDEHSLMAEALGLCLGVATAAAAIRCAERPRATSFALLGALGAAASLVRLNQLLFVPIVIGVLLLVRGADGNPRPWRSAAAALAFAMVLLPWLLFSVFRARAVTLNPGDCRLRLLYLAEWGLVDRELPALAPYRDLYDPARPESALAVDAELRRLPVAKARTLACDIAEASERASPARLWRARGATLLAFFGWDVRLPIPAGAAGMRYEFREVFARPEAIGAAQLQGEAHRLDGLAPGRATAATRTLCRAGLFYLERLRAPALTAAALAGLALLAGLARRREVSASHRVGAAFAAAWIGTAILHAGRLAWSDRFSVQFDWLGLAILLAAASALAAFRTRSGAAIG